MGSRGARGAAAQQAIEGLKELVGEGLAVEELFRRADELLRGVLEYDAVCWHSADPATGLVTSVLSDDLSLATFEDAVRLEVWEDDYATFPKIRLSGVRAETLSRATRGELSESIRFRELISPAGFGDELRAVFDAHGGMWGCAAFMRGADRGPYLGQQRELADLAARHLGNALRACHLPAVGETGPGAGPGEGEPGPAVVVLGPSNRLLAMAGPAEDLLLRLADPSRTSLGVPTAFAIAAEQARRTACGLPVPQTKIRVQDRDGQWYVLHGSALKGGAAGEVTVVAAPATPADAMPLYLSAYGLTVREQEVALLLVRGCDTRDVSRLLAMTPYTVQDHLKSVFAKAGVASRRELVARIMLGGGAP
ncbi:helix-turn-helix transcriptional regulator [Streptomyces sp. BE303]|uniref:helix-turn-helix transcriptional regulator n=1 Tax=Streptomyces sp. BE303 TaxID=3002528 RepID=UPI002E75FBED|nr:helix-turn-helix transcriptional regulator [Streptomyces sp. BE303]MED7955179.1 helix-turn-helix transcriptional regulator [Streptomyces sp. BE303]